MKILLWLIKCDLSVNQLQLTSARARMLILEIESGKTLQPNLTRKHHWTAFITRKTREANTPTDICSHGSGGMENCVFKDSRIACRSLNWRLHIFKREVCQGQCLCSTHDHSIYATIICCLSENLLVIKSDIYKRLLFHLIYWEKFVVWKSKNREVLRSLTSHNRKFIQKIKSKIG